MEPLGNATRDQIRHLLGVLRTVRLGGQQQLLVKVDVVHIAYLRMPNAIGREERRHIFQPVARIRVIARCKEIRELVTVFRIVAHARHGGRRATGIESRTRHSIESIAVGILLVRHVNVLDLEEVYPVVRELRADTEGRAAEGIAGEIPGKVRDDLLCRRVRDVLLVPVRHLMPEDGGDFVTVVAARRDEAVVHADKIGETAVRVELVVRNDLQAEGERVVAQDIVSLFEEDGKYILRDPHRLWVYLARGITQLLLIQLVLQDGIVARIQISRTNGRRFARCIGRTAENVPQPNECLGARHAQRSARQERCCRCDGRHPLPSLS